MCLAQGPQRSDAGEGTRRKKLKNQQGEDHSNIENRSEGVFRGGTASGGGPSEA